MKYRVTHITEFLYHAQVGLCHNEARLLPMELPHQQVLSATLDIEPSPQDRFDRLDYFGNRTSYFSIQEPHEQMRVTATSEVLVKPPELGEHPAARSREATLFDSPETRSWESVRDRLRSEPSAETIEAYQYTFDSPMVGVDDQLADYARSSFPAKRPLDEAVFDLMQRIYREFKYDPEFSTIATPLHEVLAHRSGVCQDFAHLAIGCLRSLGLAARYISGYIETEPAPGEERLVGADASHAWFSVFAPGFGWLDFDPTNNQVPREQHITLAWGRDYADVTPLKGVVVGGGKHELKVAVDVARID